jgi:phosphoribosyl 1,2-cyclic phosphate phosphodiesterase
MSGDVLRFTILGCGSSPGVPRIGNDWGSCDPRDPRNRRRRASLLIERVAPTGKKTTVVVDTGPDFREQMLSAEVEWADGVVYTHPHADHIHGIDDLRSFVINRRRRVDVYAEAETMRRLHQAFGYCFATPPGSSYPPILRDTVVTAGVPFTVDGEGGPVEILPYRQIHGDIESLGLKVGGFAYSSDVSAFPPETLPLIEGAEVFVVDALRYTPHPSHFSVDEAIAVAGRVGAKRTILTHMHIDLDYRALHARLPADIEPAYDGMVVEMDIGPLDSDT